MNAYGSAGGWWVGVISHSEPEAARVGPFCGYKGARKRERASGVGGAVL